MEYSRLVFDQSYFVLCVIFAAQFFFLEQYVQYPRTLYANGWCGPCGRMLWIYISNHIVCLVFVHVKMLRVSHTSTHTRQINDRHTACINTLSKLHFLPYNQQFMLRRRFLNSCIGILLTKMSYKYCIRNEAGKFH